MQKRREHRKDADFLSDMALKEMPDKYSEKDVRPWGYWESFELKRKPAIIKLLYINRGEKLSYQYHNRRSEYWKVVSGKITAVIEGRKRIFKEGSTVKVPIKKKHRIIAVEDSIILEMSFGSYDEKDIVRLKDEYGRVKRSK